MLLSSPAFFAGRLGSSNWVGENESESEVAHDGHEAAPAGISRSQFGQFIRGGLYRSFAAFAEFRVKSLLPFAL